MTQPSLSDDEEYAHGPEKDENPSVFEVFHPDHTLGVACDRDGEIVGMYIADEARENGETWLSAEILRLTRLAHLKSRAGLRKEMERQGTSRSTIDSFDLPTDASYQETEDLEFGRTARDRNR
ncbi:hypothetical protein NN3_23280 [Nocardia neocaledoniensis NBRC 108232]|uniref:Uncharacterized protein n=1 Tax=Nocardia neocaledoniensis TaxID=236511 RepID=A0A317N0W8_9NOCA|nr:hypothetical protein [Nocardia neocaledoniensis]PWV66942.1 hypothetical protein DFR69_1227 [Nocardia neocaledoniensis]GEM31321.1 hypothetical protein NN3_23280 [Nocardia neocaledoniensis NBRC 108232]